MALQIMVRQGSRASGAAQCGVASADIVGGGIQRPFWSGAVERAADVGRRPLLGVVLTRIGLTWLGLLGVLVWPGVVRADRPDASIGLEPDIVQVQSAARARELRLAAGFLVPPPAWQAALPTRLSVSLSGRDDLDISGTEYQDGVRRKVATEGQLGWRLEAQWDLSLLAGDPQRLSYEKARDQARRRADAAVELVTRLYFERRALQLAFLSGAGDDPARQTKRWVHIMELGARIDAMTDGLIRTAGVDWWRPPRGLGPAG